MRILIAGDISTWNVPNFEIQNLNPEIRESIRSADSSIFNLEGPIGDPSLGERTFSESKSVNLLLKNLNQILKKEQPQVFSNEKILKLLKLSKKPIVTLANNHIKDLGKGGFLNTRKILQRNDIDFVGGEERGESKSKIDLNEEIVLLNYNLIGKKYGLNLYGSNKRSFGASSDSFSNIKKEVTKLHEEGKQVILILHLGKEMVEDVDNWDTDLNIVKSIDADITVIHHPHIYIKTEYEKDNIFILGDFIFNRPGVFDENRKTAFLEININPQGIETKVKRLAVSDIYKY
jgi:poly-gamma-glutamate capsule biosynthesis protein CapA/YwtB (metallophosphatase superfamily)